MSESETDDTDRLYFLRRMPHERQEVFLARMLLRTLECLSQGDEAQQFLDIYNALKPVAETSVRGRRTPGSH